MPLCPSCLTPLKTIRRREGIYFLCEECSGRAVTVPQGRFIWVQLPAWGAFALWLGLQAVGVIKQINGFSNVNSLAHLGGVMAGFLAWILWRRLHYPQQR